MNGPQDDASMGLDKTWSVHRQDDNGNRFVVQTGLSRAEAEKLAAELESRGHKQVYWVEPDSRL